MATDNSRKMSVRRAKYSDAHQLKGLVREAWKSTSYGHLDISESMLTRSVHEYLTHQNSQVWVTETEGELTGLLAASIGRLEISEALASSDSVFYCKSGEGRKLIRRYVRWAEKKGAAVIGMGVSSGSDRAGELIESAGFNRVGGNYYMGVSGE